VIIVAYNTFYADLEKTMIICRICNTLADPDLTTMTSRCPECGLVNSTLLELADAIDRLFVAKNIETPWAVPEAPRAVQLEVEQMNRMVSQ